MVRRQAFLEVLSTTTLGGKVPCVCCVPPLKGFVYIPADSHSTPGLSVAKFRNIARLGDPPCNPIGWRSPPSAHANWSMTQLELDTVTFPKRSEINLFIKAQAFPFTL
jgi:hypothetical protein